MFPLDHHPQSGNTESNAKLVFLDFRASIKINFSFAFRRFHNKKKFGSNKKAQPGKAKRVEITNDLTWAGARSERACLVSVSRVFFLSIGKFNAN